MVDRYVPLVLIFIGDPSGPYETSLFVGLMVK